MSWSDDDNDVVTKTASAGTGKMLRAYELMNVRRQSVVNSAVMSWRLLSEIARCPNDRIGALIVCERGGRARLEKSCEFSTTLFMFTFLSHESKSLL